MEFFKYTLTFLDELDLISSSYTELDTYLNGVVKNNLNHNNSFLPEIPTQEELDELKADIEASYELMLGDIKPRYEEVLRLATVHTFRSKDVTDSEYGDETRTGKYYEPVVSSAQAEVKTTGEVTSWEDDKVTLSREEDRVLSQEAVREFFRDIKEEVELYFVDYINLFTESCEGERPILNEEQLAALNSGIDADKVAQIETNKENITLLSSAVVNLNDNKQDKLVSGTNIKTIGGESILGSGNINMSNGFYISEDVQWDEDTEDAYFSADEFWNGHCPTRDGDLVYVTGNGALFQCVNISYDEDDELYYTELNFLNYYYFWDFVRFSDYARVNTNRAGVIKVKSAYGFNALTDGSLIIQQASNYQIQQKTSAYAPITAQNYDYAVSQSTDVTAIKAKIPNEASSSNQLADKNFVNSSIATNTANFIGTFANIPALNAYAGTVTNNDYAFVVNSVIEDSGGDWPSFADLDNYDHTLLTNFDYAWVESGAKYDLYRYDIVEDEWILKVQNTEKADVTLNTAYNRYKATVSGGTTTWEYEYTLNNSSFTANQWATINSGLTSSDATKLSGIESGAQVNVQADWLEADPDSDSYIQNKPTIPDMSTLEKVELVYDKDSADSSINWGYTNGINSGSGSIAKDLTKYKHLRIYFACYYVSSSNHGVTSNMLILDLSNEHGTNNICYSGMITPYYASNGFVTNMGIMAEYNLNSKTFFASLFYQGNAQTGGAPNGYYVYKIEGVY